MKKKNPVKRKVAKKKPVKKGPPCKYCGATVYTGVDICSNCHRKKDLVHRLWLIGQKMLADAGRLNTEKED